MWDGEAPLAGIKETCMSLLESSGRVVEWQILSSNTEFLDSVHLTQDSFRLRYLTQRWFLKMPC